MKLNAPKAPTVDMIDALTGAMAAREDVAVTWKDSTLNVRFKVPSQVNGPDTNPPRHLAYIVVRSQA